VILKKNKMKNRNACVKVVKYIEIILVVYGHVIREVHKRALLFLKLETKFV